MSWAVAAIGKASAVKRHLQQQRDKFTGDQQLAYEEALPHLIGLVMINAADGNREVVVDLYANGSFEKIDGRRVAARCSAKIQVLSTFLE